MIHPVTNDFVCRLKDSSMKVLRQEVNVVYQSFTNSSLDPITIIKGMLEKSRF